CIPRGSEFYSTKAPVILFTKFMQSGRNGNKVGPQRVPTSEQSCPGERFGRAGLTGAGALRDVSAAASRCRFQSGPLAVAQPRRCRRRRAGSAVACIPLLPWFSRRRRARLAAANRPEYLLYLARQKSPSQRYDRIQRRSARAAKPIT